MLSRGRGLGQGAGSARGPGVPVRRVMGGCGLGLPPRGFGGLGVPRPPCWLSPPHDSGAFGEWGLEKEEVWLDIILCYGG